MSKQQPPCAELFAWLRNNLGRDCMGALTGQDAPALAAIAHVLQLFSVSDSQGRACALKAFAALAQAMQPSTRELAYHAIAWAMDWHVRPDLWRLAGLEPIAQPRVCAYEPPRRAVA